MSLNLRRSLILRRRYDKLKPNDSKYKPRPNKSNDKPKSKDTKSWFRFTNWFTNWVALGTFGGLFWVFYIYYEELRWNRKFQKGILNSTTEFIPPECYIERPDLNEKIVDSIHDEGLKATIIVIGSRGVGKSTAVLSAFSDRKGVVVANCGAERNPSSVARSIIEQFVGNKPVKEVDTLHFLGRLLIHLKKNLQKPPLIIVEVDDRWESSDLQHLLLVAKKMGADHDLAHFIIIVSAAIGSFDIQITFSDLRCNCR